MTFDAHAHVIRYAEECYHNSVCIHSTHSTSTVLEGAPPCTYIHVHVCMVYHVDMIKLLCYALWGDTLMDMIKLLLPHVPLGYLPLELNHLINISVNIV